MGNSAVSSSRGHSRCSQENFSYERKTNHVAASETQNPPATLTEEEKRLQKFQLDKMKVEAIRGLCRELQQNIEKMLQNIYYILKEYVQNGGQNFVEDNLTWNKLRSKETSSDKDNASHELNESHSAAEEDCISETCDDIMYARLWKSLQLFRKQCLYYNEQLMKDVLLKLDDIEDLSLELRPQRKFQVELVQREMEWIDQISHRLESFSLLSENQQQYSKMDIANSICDFLEQRQNKERTNEVESFSLKSSTTVNSEDSHLSNNVISYNIDSIYVADTISYVKSNDQISIGLQQDARKPIISNETLFSSSECCYTDEMESLTECNQ